MNTTTQSLEIPHPWYSRALMLAAGAVLAVGATGIAIFAATDDSDAPARTPVVETGVAVDPHDELMDSRFGPRAADPHDYRRVGRNVEAPPAEISDPLVTRFGSRQP